MKKTRSLHIFIYTEMEDSNNQQWSWTLAVGAVLTLNWICSLYSSLANILGNIQDVEGVFQRLPAAGLVINFEKCTFAVPEVDFLGHRVSASVFAPLPSRVANIQKYPRPAT